MQPRKVTKVLHIGLELWDREEENPEVVDLLEDFLGIFLRKDIRVEKVEVVFHMDLELGDKEESTTVVKIWEVKELLGDFPRKDIRVEEVEAIKVVLMLQL